MNIEPKKILTQKTGRTFISGNTVNPEYIWIICHGYGHLANYFLRKFSALEDEKTLLVCPEGLNRFYVEGVSGRVGASWMTKEDREDDIRDYLFWLDKVYEEFVPENSKAKIILLGFSQGGATVCRWLAYTKKKIDHLVLYASTFPADVIPSAGFAENLNGKLFFVLGNKDEYITEEEKHKQLEILKRTGKEIKVIAFEGKHEIDAGALSEVKRDFSIKK